MGKLDERISQQFGAWEVRGRGWQVWPEPVLPEPPFREFTGYRLAPTEIVDDGRKPGFFASLLDSLQAKAAPPKPPVIIEEQEEPEPERSEYPLSTEFIAALPAKIAVRDEAWRAFLDSLHVCAGPVAFELCGKEDRISLQFASSSHDATALQRQLSAFVPDVPFVQTEKAFAEAWTQAASVGFIVDFALANEFMLPLQVQHSVDPFVGLVAAMSELRRDEMAVFQILFQPVRHPWPGSVWNSVTDKNGKMLFTNSVPLIPGTKEKLASPLFGVVIRAADEVRSPKLRRQLTRTKAAPSSVLSPTGVLFGFNEHGGRSAEVRMTAEQRVRHTHILGATGQGKSTLLFNLIQQDIANGEGVAVLDPHGDLVDRVLGIIPPAARSSGPSSSTASR